MLLTRLLRELNTGLRFSLIEVGARQVGEGEAFYALLEAFPGSVLHGFEPEADLCAEMQATAPPGVRYLPHALWSSSERRPLYVTAHPMCSSLYEPDPRYIQAFMGLKSQALARVIEVDTIDLDTVVGRYDIPPPDFIKIDIQGAELDCFKGGSNTLRSVLQILTEVEFAPLYREQPLFGDVDRFLRDQGFLFHCFRPLHGRMLKPVALDDDVTRHHQQLWTDAIFVRDYLNLARLEPDALLKAAVLADLYGSVDLALWWLAEHARRTGSDFRERYTRAILAAVGRGFV